MSRYPSSQFIVIDNTNTSASVPVTSRNPSAPIYMTTFNSPKGPEEIRTVYGSEFYDLYGSQSKMLFSTYKQPLLQASMNINGGAELIAKRAVLQDAKLANATVGVVLSRSAVPTIELDANGRVASWSVTAEEIANAKYTLRPIVMSVEDDCDVVLDNETKEYYNLHKSKIIEKVINGNSDKNSYQINTGIKYSIEVASTGVMKTVRLETEKITNGFITTPNWFINSTTADTPSNGATGITSSTEAEDIAVRKQIYSASVKEYFFPLFTLFDNGRGVSTKSISFMFDVATSKTLNKAIYSLKVFDYSTNKQLESFSFTVDPYSRNNNTGYTFDIESAVNFRSKQLRAKMHYDSYEKLLKILQTNTGVGEYIFTSADCLFGHDLKGSDLTNGAVTNSLYVDAKADTTNVNDITDLTKTIYYYYDYSHRVNYGISNLLEFGGDGSINDSVYDSSTKITNGVSLENPLAYYPTQSSNTPITLETVIQGKHQVTLSQTAINLIDPTIILANGTVSKDNLTFTTIDIEGNKTEITMEAEVTTAGSPTIYKTYLITKTYTWESSYQEEYRKFFMGTFDKDIFNLDIFFPTAVFDANYSYACKLAIQRLAAYRGDFIAYLDMKTSVKSLEDVVSYIPLENEENEFPENGIASYYYVRDMHNAVTCIYYDTRDPYTNKQITVTGTYGLSLAMINHYISGPGKVFAGKSNGVTFGGAIEGTINYIPKVYPSSAMVSLSNIGATYPSDDSTIVNEKQQMCDLRVNYGSYYDGLFVMDTEYTLNPTESEFSYINNVMLVNKLIQEIRKACPAARYNFIDGDDLQKYEDAVSVVIKANRSSFASVTFRYLQDENSIANKIFYAALEIVFRPFAQAEIFTITALNYSTLDSNVTTV